MPTLPDFRLETYFSRWEFRAKYHLAASDAESMSLGELLSLAEPGDRQAWETMRLGYTETFGSPAFRQVLTSTYDSLAAEDVICFAGAQEAIYCAMHALLSPGDHAIVVVPNYQSLEELPLSICDVTGVALQPSNGWALDLDDIRRAIRPSTSLIAVNFPHNPTGRIIPHEDFVALVDLAASRGIYLFSDEVYRGLERDSARRLPQAADLYERALSLGVMSKALGLPGLRIGWIACRDRAVLSRMERMKHYLSICNSAPSELLATIAIKARERILARNRALVDRNLTVLGAFFEEHRAMFDWSVPDGGCIGYPRYLGDDGVESFCQMAVEEAGVLLLPASIYESRLLPAPTDRFRIGYGRRNMPEALGALAELIERSQLTASS